MFKGFRVSETDQEITTVAFCSFLMHKTATEENGRGMARPRSTTPSVRVTVTLDREDHERIAALAHRLRASTASVVRRAVAELLEREHSPSAGERVAERDAVS
jgi:Ribbon-helix-helix protein, copG family